jgi:hypothetical protein
MKLLLVLCLITISFQIEMKVYDKAGSYVLTPEDYDYKPNIFIQLWGAGSGSSDYLGYNGLEYSYPGNSGAYIFANISTLNGEIFEFYLGKGGICPYFISVPGMQCIPNVYIGYNGENSTFSSQDKEVYFNVSGGQAFAYVEDSIYLTAKKAIINAIKFRADDSLLEKSDGYLCFDNYIENGIINSAILYGATSPFGQIGGSMYPDQQYRTECNGYRGSGAGQYCNTKPSDPNINYYQGGDGALIVYY